MFGLSFLNGIFLVGLIAAAVPVIIHLLNRRRIKRIKFSSLEFLEEVSRRRMSKINLRRLLILALRTLAVLMLVLAFARPTLRNPALFLPGKAPKNVVVCLDVSYSMGLEQEQGTAFSAARTVAKRVVDEAGKNDAINLVLFGATARPRLEQGTRNKAMVKGAIDDARLSATPTSIRRGIEKAYELIDASSIDGGEIYVVSDFRFNEDSVLVSADDRRDDVRVYFLPVGDADADNVSIDRVMVPRKLMRPGEVVRVSVAVTNHSRSNPVSFPLELRVDDARKAERVVELAPSASTTVTFPISFAEWGSYACSVSKNRDRLPVDDERYFLLDVSRSVPVTVVRGRRRVGGDNSPVAGFFYLEKALNPRGTADGEFVVRTVDEKDLTASALPTRGVVVWVDPQRLESKRLALLERYVRRGGGLMVYLGGSARRLSESKALRDFLGMKSAGVRSSDVRVGYTSFRQDHPVFGIFDEEELELLSRTRVSSYVAATGVAPDSTLAYVGGGDPALWECTRGRGRILVFAAAPDLESGDIPLSPMFLPLVHTSVSYLASAGQSQRQGENLAGRQLAFDASQAALSSARLVIRTPGGDVVEPVMFETPQGEMRVYCESPDEVGFYRLQSDTTTIAQAAINLDARESNISVSSLPEDGARDAGVSIVTTGNDFISDLQQERQGREVFAFFVFIAAAALVAESVLGRKA